MSSGRIIRPQGQTKTELPRIGQIKTGYKTESGQPRSTDFFLATGNYSKFFEEAYGEKPKSIQIVFIDDEPSNSCSERYEYRDKSGALYAYGDGKNFNVWSERKEQYIKTNTDERPELMDSIEKKVPSHKFWEITLTLTFVIPRIKLIAGVWQYSTKGAASTIPNIRKSFDTMLELNGFVKGVVFDLNVEFQKSQKPNTPSRFPVVSLVANESDDNIKQAKGGIVSVGKQIYSGK